MAKALQLIGEGWTILIIREAFMGTRRFEDFQRELGIARNILSDRLKKLVEHHLLKRIPIQPGAKRFEYRLTEQGLDLMPTLIALTQWGDQWISGPEQAPIKFLDRESGQEIAPIRLRAGDGHELSARDLALAPGPGADDYIYRRIKALAEREAQQQAQAQAS